MSVKLTGMNMKSTIINESGLYEAIIGSKKKEVKPFKRWITREVLPTIRKHGAYVTDEEDKGKQSLHSGSDATIVNEKGLIL